MALQKVRTLEGLLPICAWCRRVRSDRGYWQKLEEYLAKGGAEITHSICGECAEEYIEELQCGGSEIR